MQNEFHLVLAVSINLILSGLELVDKLTAKNWSLIELLLFDRESGVDCAFHSYQVRHNITIGGGGGGWKL